MRKLPQAVQLKVIDKIDGLIENPRPSGSKKLVGSTDLWRVRIGDYRIIYSVADDVLVIEIIKVGHRKDIY